MPVQEQTRRRNVALVVLSSALAIIALAAVEHERVKVAETGTSVLCGTLFSCLDNLDTGSRYHALEHRMVKSRASALLASEKGCHGKGCLMSQRNSKPSDKKSAVETLNGFNIFDFGGEAQDSVLPRSKIEEYQQPGDVEGDVAVDASATTPFADLVGHDRIVPFTEHGRFLQPGDVPGDVPDRHHETGPFSIFGLFKDEDENLLTGETVEQACCRCIPGAPDYRESLPQSSSTGGNVFANWFSYPSSTAHEERKGGHGEKVKSERKGPNEEAKPAQEGAAASSGATPSPATDFPVVEAFPLVEAQPADVSPSPSNSNSTAARRLLQAVQRAHGARLTILKEGYMLVHIPVTAKPGEYYKAMTPSGETWAFKVPDVLPPNRIVKVHMPDLSSAPAHMAVRSKRMSLQEVNSSSNETEIIVPPLGGNASMEGNETAESPAPEQGAEPGAAEEDRPMEPSFPPPSMKAKSNEPCCMCPLYDEKTGEIEGWLSDAPRDELKAARKYLYVARAIAVRDEEVNKQLNGSTIHWEGMFPSRKYACCRLELPCCYEEMEEGENSTSSEEIESEQTAEDNTTVTDENRAMTGGNETDMPAVGMSNGTSNASVSSNASLSGESSAPEIVIGAENVTGTVRVERWERGVDHAMSFQHLSQALRHFMKSKLHAAKKAEQQGKGKKLMSDQARKIVKIVKQQAVKSHPQSPLPVVASKSRAAGASLPVRPAAPTAKSSSSSSPHPSRLSPLAKIVRAKLSKLPPAEVAPVAAAAVPVKGIARPVQAIAAPMKK
ncbi:60S ribosomal protein L22, PPC-targeted [Guillardia theta CCMP2712]|uniref:60S ribosomal protein L22, PPC-targeted n=1 Tax=Guillardia theta (strain CCMP2712) TaxID=905079 RepID=L1J356_GUITC|nr:60S ribosomal protein L22, PPC-targeted [Guillardia theta CCMP2712]EKX42737.1 60S ribosomal protein L22, PPC-targeted [Guillardia theta CCMP2712]|eukprot:XP_005829717.1 60S ribosomal protein L22, PPC-targeted [Guillardia theta CCMP2712]